MRSLLDVNVLVALIDPQSATHPAANSFLAANFADGWASCPMTENACLRLLTNPRYHAPAQPSIVLARLEETKQAGNHAFWPDDVSITDEAVFDWDRLQGHQQITDVYLLALAVSHGARLVTFDQGIRREAVRACGAHNLVTL